MEVCWLKIEPWRVYGPTVVRIKVKSWIRISIKLMRIRNPAYTFQTYTFLTMPYTFLTLTYTFPDPYTFPTLITSRT
jgi:hypothetical protein